MGLSIRAYARHRGVSHVAVKKAIDTGRITPEADGTIEPNRADLEWAQNTVSTRQPAAAKASPPKPEPRPRGLPELTTPALSTGGTSLLQARTFNEVLKFQKNKLELAILKDEQVERARVVAHIYVRSREEREAWLNWPARVSAQMAARLEVDAHEMHIALETAVREHLIELGEFQNPV
jgi:hypothetical protein